VQSIVTGFDVRCVFPIKSHTRLGTVLLQVERIGIYASMYKPKECYFILPFFSLSIIFP
jgi:hypothetical protein